MVLSRQIEMHFTEIMSLSEQIDKLAENLRTAARNELMQIICKNKACWNSSCAEVLIGKEEQIGMGLLFEAEELCRIAAEMRQQAKRMYQAELTNNQLAATRTYSQQSWK